MQEHSGKKVNSYSKFEGLKTAEPVEKKIKMYNTIMNILQLLIYTSMNHSLPFKPRALALQNI